MVYEMLLHGAPPSGVGAIINSVAKKVVPFEQAKVPTDRTVKQLRMELALITDAMSARVLARCNRILQLGHDGTDINGTAVLAANVQIETERGELGLQLLVAVSLSD